MIFLTSLFFTIPLFSSVYASRRDIESREHNVYSVNDTPSLDGKATRTDGRGGAGQILLKSSAGVTMASERMLFFLFFFCLFSSW